MLVHIRGLNIERLGPDFGLMKVSAIVMWIKFAYGILNWSDQLFIVFSTRKIKSLHSLGYEMQMR